MERKDHFTVKLKLIEKNFQNKNTRRALEPKFILINFSTELLK